MMEEKDIVKISIEKDGLVSFDIKNSFYSYRVFSNKDTIKVFREDSPSYVPAFKFDRETKEGLWYIDHCCGSQGFGLGMDDECSACKYDGKTTDPIIGKVNGRMDYFERNDIDIEKLCSSIEDRLEGVFELYSKNVKKI